MTNKFQDELKEIIQRLVDACTYLAVMAKTVDEVERQEAYIKTLETILESLIARAVDIKAVELSCAHHHTNHSCEDDLSEPEYWIAEAEKNDNS